MPSTSEESLDRRDFMIASIATIGAPAARGQCWFCERPELSDFLCQPRRRGRHQRRSKPATQSRGKRSSARSTSTTWSPDRSTFCIFGAFRCPPDSTGYVSVTVAKGAKPGKRVVLVSGVHGDEMSSVHTVQTIMNQLDPTKMSGTVMAVTNVVPRGHGRHAAQMAQFGQRR